ncbi:MAG TPA: DNA polymerase I [Myxococcota bacterium]|nr:DNA polymerase I [Myxococcota bacterium]
MTSSAKTPSRSGHLLVVDAANTLYRAFFALPPLRSSKGVPTHAALGFVTQLLKVLREQSPDHVVVVMDAPGRSFRAGIYPAYKATRDKQPEDLSAQIPLVRELVAALGLPLLEVPGVEADDVIATLVAKAPPEMAVTIVSTDKDLMQLVSERVHLLDTMKDRRFGPAEVEERFGVPVELVLDLRALVGDPSDNIPGVHGIGEKGAAQLLREWGSLDALLAHASEVPAKRAREALLAHAEEARLSRRLATLERDVALPLSLDALHRGAPDSGKLRELYRELEFTRLLQGLEAGEPSASPAAAAPTTAVAPVAAPGEATAPRATIVATPDDLSALARELAGEESLLVTALPPEGDAMRDPVVGLGIALSDERAAWLPLGRHSLVSGPTLAPDVVCEALRPLLSGKGAKPWGGLRCQRTLVALGEAGLEMAAPRFDVEVAAFLLDPAAQRGLPAIAARFLGARAAGFEEVAGRGAKSVAAVDLPGETLAAFAAGEVCLARRLEPVLRAKLEADGLVELFDAVEMPLAGVLARMERTGVRIDERKLAELSKLYESELARIEGEIFQLAGERFAIASPKQLQRVLFEKLMLPAVRKTKTGFSTDESVLEQLASQHPLPERILAHRRLAKLKGTYVDALPPLVNPRTGRVHPTFVQTGAATGRLACVNPNVQNIPIRTAEGVRIREAFVPAEGMRLLSADYSQVELRILAHFSGDESLIDAFRHGEDIHRRTWAEVAGKKPEEVTADERARAKAVNFGIVYGSSAFGLAQQLGIATAEAQATIDAYFARYRGVRRFLDETVREARERGFVRTLYGRRRYLPDLASANRVLRNAAERMAVNSVIQGTAADLIKRAMVAIDAALRAGGPAASLILQVHDELVFEVGEADEASLRALVVDRMRGAGALRVPLDVEVGAGLTWREAH